jgi:hypothetical protein
MISITFEILVYNENYQTGVLLALEFLKNNAGKIDKTLSVTPFYESKYQSSNHMISSSQRNISIALDVIYLLFILFISYRIFKILIRKLVETIRLKIIMFELHDAIDLIILIMNYITMTYYVIVIILEDRIQIPVKTLEKFTTYVEEAENTLILMYLSTGTIILMTLRLIIIIILHFPIFGAIFYTITSAFKDLLNILLTLLVIITGLSYSLFLIFGSNSVLFNDVWTIMLHTWYRLMNPNSLGLVINEIFYYSRTPYIISIFLYSMIYIIYFTLIMTLLIIGKFLHLCLYLKQNISYSFHYLTLLSIWGCKFAEF